MILQALNHYYERLAQTGTLERPGWQTVKVSYALEIDGDGRLVRVLPLMSEVENGKKKVLVPRTMNLPAQVKKSGTKPKSNLLCENAAFMLGVDNEHDLGWAKQRFETCKGHHTLLLSSVKTPEAQAVLRYFEKWKPEEAMNCAMLQPFMGDNSKGVNFTFVYNGRFIHEYSEIQRAWDEHYNADSGGETMRCLVTGEKVTPARLHPNIQGLQSMGNTLVSFNAPAYESYGRDGGQGLNAPVGERAAFAYSQALNYMIATQGHCLRLSDTTMVFWAESGDEAYASCFAALLGEESPLTEDDIYQALKGIAAGRSIAWGETDLNPDERFYILGLAPNKTRLSVRFFMQDTFGDFASHLQEHHDRMNIVRPEYDSRTSLSFYQLLDETVNKKSRDKSPSPLLSGALVRSVLMGLPYPALLLEQTELRVRAERQITRGRAAIIKAFLLRNTRNTEPYERYKEALSVELNENTNYPPYLLGRLFAVLEGLQQAANHGINTTIRDRFFNSACATPGVVFPQLIKLAQAHLKKLDGGLAVHYNRQMGDLLGRFDSDYPVRLNLYDQGIFQLGYYHQVQARYAKKEEK